MVRHKWLWVTLLLVGLAFPSREGEAHAVLVGSSPENGAALAEAPAAAEVQFNEPVTADFTPLLVRDQAGRGVDAGDAAILATDPSRVRVGLKPLAHGFYTVIYRVTSLDGHPVYGTLAFSVGPVAEGAMARPDQMADQGTSFTAITAAAGLLHGAALYLAMVLAGLPIFLLWIWRPIAGPANARFIRRLTIATMGAMAAVGFAEVVLYALRASGEELSLALVRQGLLTSVGKTWLLRMVGALGAGAILLGVPRIRTGDLSAWTTLPGAALLATFTWQSHAMASREPLAVAMDWLHLLAAAPWVGGLVGFALLGWSPFSQRTAAERAHLFAQAVPRFSRLATASVAVLAVTGAYAVWLHVPSWAGVTGTAYGVALLVKLTLVACVLALGLYNLLHRGGGAFRLAVLSEAILVLGIFAAVGVLTTVPPADVALAAMQGPFHGTAEVGGLAISLDIRPARVGHNDWSVRLTRPDGSPVTEANVGLRIDMPEHDMGEQKPEGREQTPGTYQGEQVILGMHGEWVIEVVALTRQGQEVRHRFRIWVPEPFVS